MTTTSYAVLSQLGVRSWSAYELTQQMSRSLSWYWPKAESLLYAEFKKLAALRLASAHREHQGRRARTVYTITEDGRTALRGWLDTALNPHPRLEWEAMLQVAYADHGTRAQLLDTLKAIRADADRTRAAAHEQIRDYARTAGPFRERLPITALTGKFFLEYADLLARWAAWAERAVTDWDGVHPDGATVPECALEPRLWPDDPVVDTPRSGPSAT